MLRLIQNEFIKVFSKIGTWILLLLGTILILGTQFFYRDYSSYRYSQYTEESMTSEIAYLNEVKPKGYELRVERCEFIIENELFFIEGGWKESAVIEAFDQYRATMLSDEATETEKKAAEVSFDRLTSQLKSDAWQGYYQDQIERIAQMGEYSKEEIASMQYPYQYMVEYQVIPYENDWREAALWSYQSNQMEVLQAEKAGKIEDQESYDAAKAAMEADKWRLEHNQKDVVGNLVKTQKYGKTPDLFWMSMNSSTMLIQALAVFLIIIAAGSIASEFSGGTIKFLLINPVKRGKIFFSKYLMLLLLSIIGLIGVFGLQVLFASIVHGGSLSVPWLYADGSELVVGSGLHYIIKQYLLNSAELFIYMTMAFMISSAIRSSTVSIGVSIAVLLAGKTIVKLLAELNQDWGRYLIFSNTSLVESEFIFPGQTITFAVVVIVAYMLVFLLTAYDGFTRREV